METHVLVPPTERTDLHEHMIPVQSDFYRELLDHINHGIYFVDRDRTILYWNQGAVKLTGYESDEVIGRRCQDDLLCHVDSGGRRLCHDGCPLSATIQDGRGHNAVVFLRHKEGRRVPVTVTVQPLFGPDGSILGGVELFSDATVQAEASRRIRELEEMAFLDHLTTLPNRRYMEIALHTAISEFHAHEHPFGVLSIDLDRFKEINDSHGHSMGDTVLKQTAKTLRGALRSSDVIGRWGGDEFLGIIHFADVELLRSIAERCATLISEVAIPLQNGQKLRPSASVGATLACFDDDAETILLRADDHLYRRKRGDESNRLC